MGTNRRGAKMKCTNCNKSSFTLVKARETDFIYKCSGCGRQLSINEKLETKTKKEPAAAK